MKREHKSFGKRLVYSAAAFFCVAALFDDACTDGGSAAANTDTDTDADTDTDTDIDTDTDLDADSDTDGCPSDMVEVPGMNACIDAYEYTNSRFAVFLAENGNDCGEAICRNMWSESQHVSNEQAVCESGQGADYVTGKDFTQIGVMDEYEMAEGVGDYPVGWVTWYGARDTCLWEGKTMCPWDIYYAACSHGGEWYFPWGGETGGEPTNEGWINAWEDCLCNGYSASDTYSGGFEGCEGAYTGLFDLVGNIGEWGGTPELDGWWAYMGGSHDSFYVGDGPDGEIAGAACAFPETWNMTGGPKPLPADYEGIAYAWEDHGFRCCLLDVGSGADVDSDTDTDTDTSTDTDDGCPEVCNGGCVGGSLCTILDPPGPVECPAGWSCAIACVSTPCPGPIGCTLSYDCNIYCEAADSCQGEIACGDYPCNLTCSGANSCKGPIAADSSTGASLILGCSGPSSCGGGVTCEDGIDGCFITCSGTGSCAGDIDMQGGEGTYATCSGDGSCAGMVNCGPDSCGVGCNGVGACGGTIDCSTSCACSVHCGGGDCTAVDVTCPAGCESAGEYLCDHTITGCDTCG